MNEAPEILIFRNGNRTQKLHSSAHELSSLRGQALLSIQHMYTHIASYVDDFSKRELFLHGN